MASIRPARVTWVEEMTDGDDRWVFFTMEVGSSEIPVFGGDILMAASKAWGAGHPPPDLEERYRFAVKPSGITPPTWASPGEGPISYVGGSLLIILDSGKLSTTCFQVGRITDAWDESSNLATLQGLTVLNDSPPKESTSVERGHGAPQALFVSGLWFISSAPYGLMWQLRNDGAGVLEGNWRFGTDPVPVILRHYRYTATDVARDDATERTDISAEALSVLQERQEYQKFFTTMKILLSETNPAEADIELTPVRGLPATISRNLNWGETWLLDLPSAGGIPLSMTQDGTKLEGIRDSVVETTIYLKDRFGEEHEIVKQLQVVGDIARKKGSAELELRSPIDSVMSARVTSYHPATASEVQYEDETVLTILADVLLNSGKWLYRRFHYNDIAALHARFAWLWNEITLTSGDLEDMTVENVFALLGPALGLCISQAADGCIDLWHPGIYRPSRKVHYLNETDCLPGGFSFTDQGRDGQYNGVAVAGDDYPNTFSIQYPIDRLVTHEGRKENLYEVVLPVEIWDTNTKTLGKCGIGRQLAQRFCGSRVEIRMVLGLKGMTVDIGDIIVLASSHTEDPVPALVINTSMDPARKTNEIIALYYPDAMGLHSVWTDDGVRGIWRWRKLADPYYDLENQAHGTAPDGAWTLIAGTPLTRPLSGHWQGSCAKFTASNSGMLSGAAGISDIFDLCLLVNGDLGTPTNPAALGITDATIGTIMAWVFSGAPNRYLILHWQVDDAESTPSVYTNRLGIGIVERVDRSPMPWEKIWYSPYGAIGRAAENLPVSIAIEWKDTTIRVFIDRRLVIEATDAALNKDLYAPLAGTLYLHNGASESRIGCLRHIRQTGLLQERQRLQGLNGIDPYYGPDVL